MSSLAIGIGSGAKGNGLEAARAALKGCGGLPPAAVLLLSGYHGVDHYAMLKGVREVFPETPLIGGTTFGEICGPELLEGSAVVWALAGPRISAAAGLGKGMARDPFAAGAAAARQARAGLKGEPRLFLIFYETQMGDTSLAIEGVKSVLGRNFPIVGAGTGSGLIMEQNPFSKQFLGGQVLGGCFVGLLLSGDFALSCGYSHGGRLVSRSCELTGVARNVLREIDGRPALDVFEEALDLRLGLRGLSYLDVHLAVEEPSLTDATTLRALWGACVEERTLYCGNPIEQGTRFRFAQVRAETILQRQRESMEEAKKRLKTPVAGALCIDCYGRKMTLTAQNLIGEELRLIHELIGGAPMAGLYSGSETGMLGWGSKNQESRYAHQSTAFVLFGEK